jgi:hypothetical protein
MTGKAKRAQCTLEFKLKAVGCLHSGKALRGSGGDTARGPDVVELGKGRPGRQACKSRKKTGQCIADGPGAVACESGMPEDGAR